MLNIFVCTDSSSLRFYPGLGDGGLGAYTWNTEHDAGIQYEWDTDPSPDTIHTHSHGSSNSSVDKYFMEVGGNWVRDM